MVKNIKDMLFKNYSVTKGKQAGKNVSVLRWHVILLISIAMSFITWNPSGHHFVHFVQTLDLTKGFSWVYILLYGGILVSLLHFVFVKSGWKKSVLIILIGVAFMKGLQDYGYFDFHDLNKLGWAANILLVVLIFVSLNINVWIKTLTGTYAVDHVGDED